MTFIPADYSYPSSRPWVYGIVVLLVITLMAVPIQLYDQPEHITFKTFYDAGLHFMQGLDPYGVYEGFDYYKMSPTFLLVLIGFAQLPFFAAAMLWQFVSIVLFFIAIVWIMRSLPLKNRLGFGLSLFLPFLLLVDFQLNGTHLQSNTIMLSVAMLGLLFYTQGRYVLAAILIAWAANMKIYPLVLMLLLFLDLRWRFIVSSLLAHVVLLLLPYVFLGIDQANILYHRWYELLLIDKTFTYDDWVHHFISLKAFLESNFNWILQEDYVWVILISAALVAIPAIWLRIKSGFFSVETQFLLLAVSMAWILLFSTRTEGATLVLTAPIYTYALWWVMNFDDVFVRRIAISGLVFVFFLTSMSTSDIFRHTWVHPFMWQHNVRTVGLMLAFLFSVGVLWQQAYVSNSLKK
jgi:hypothetical protein